MKYFLFVLCVSASFVGIGQSRIMSAPLGRVGGISFTRYWSDADSTGWVNQSLSVSRDNSSPSRTANITCKVAQQLATELANMSAAILTDTANVNVSLATRAAKDWQILAFKSDGQYYVSAYWPKYSNIDNYTIWTPADLSAAHTLVSTFLLTCPAPK
jgi:hypothetical protein